MIDRDETRDRFLAAIAEKVVQDTIVEAHLFPPLRQGGQESGVAVVAVDRGPEIPSDAPADAPAVETADAPTPAERRLTVYSAKYRLTLKGPERGKWEFSMQAEADAPRVTIDQVVQGVQRRSGDEEDPLRLSGEEFRALLAPAERPA